MAVQCLGLKGLVVSLNGVQVPHLVARLANDLVCRDLGVEAVDKDDWCEGGCCDRLSRRGGRGWGG